MRLNNVERRERNQLIGELYKSGLSCSEIAPTVGMAPQSVLCVLRKTGVKRRHIADAVRMTRKPRRYVSKKHAPKIAKECLSLLDAKRLSYSQAADILGISRNAVAGLVNRWAL